MFLLLMIILDNAIIVNCESKTYTLFLSLIKKLLKTNMFENHQITLTSDV